MVLFPDWSGGGHAHAETYYPSAKGGQKGDPFFVVVAWSRGRVVAWSWSWSRGVVRPVLKKCHFVVEIPFLRYFFEAGNASKVTPF